MSTYSYNVKVNDVDHEVMMGWDPALHRFWLVVCREEDEDLPFYSNLDDEVLTSNPDLYQDLAYFRKKLRELGLGPIPDDIDYAMQKDQVD